MVSISAKTLQSLFSKLQRLQDVDTSLGYRRNGLLTGVTAIVCTGPIAMCFLPMVPALFAAATIILATVGLMIAVLRINKTSERIFLIQRTVYDRLWDRHAERLLLKWQSETPETF